MGIASPAWTITEHSSTSGSAMGQKILKRPHSSPSIPYTRRNMLGGRAIPHARIYKFTHDGKDAVSDHGTPTRGGARLPQSFQRPTYLAWASRQHHGSSPIGYQRHACREVRQGRQVPDGVGQKGTIPDEKRPGYMNNVPRHRGRPADAPRLRQWTAANHRAASLDENGNSLRTDFGEDPSVISPAHISLFSFLRRSFPLP